jgi:hypothetical protein
MVTSSIALFLYPIDDVNQLSNNGRRIMGFFDDDVEIISIDGLQMKITDILLHVAHDQVFRCIDRQKANRLKV